MWHVSTGRHDPRIDPSLIEEALSEEIELLLRLIQAANASDGHLDPATLDAILFDRGPGEEDPEEEVGRIADRLGAGPVGRDRGAQEEREGPCG